MKRILFFLFVIISSLGDSNKDKNVNNDYIEEMSSEPLILKLFKSGYKPLFMSCTPDDDPLGGGHSSHKSHQSHESHQSHRSHYSSR